ncbi:MAG: hypothetical protein CMQ49_10160 [Gammaproteobacteria bacterium]|nr:hypothetical protein [Gammaproteobacteria bacterium]|tara:strand:+ start:6768 stop:7499 length:732 start_codon:yes stop_codon:yes gene_type:complete
MVVEAGDGAKVMYLIKGRPESTREELVAHWFANHMPGVIASQARAVERGRLAARRYIATLFDPDRDGNYAWDGVAQLWFDSALPRPRVPHGTEPGDSFQEHAMPYLPWGTREYVVMDGAAHLPVQPLTLNDPFPCTRSGFFKVTFLVKAKPHTDYDAFFRHWLTEHAPNVANTMSKVDGFRYVVSHSIEPNEEPYAGMAELYFHDPDGWRAYKQTIEPDGMEAWAQDEDTLVLRSRTEMIGIP